MNYYKEHKKELDKVLLSLAVVYFIYIFITYVYTYLAPFFVAFILSRLIDPIIRILVNEFKIKRGIATFLSIILAMWILFLFGRYIIYVGIEQGNRLFAEIDFYIIEITEIIATSNYVFNEFLMFPGSDIVTEGLITLFRNMASTGMSFISRILVTSVPRFFINIVVVIVATFFFSKDRELIASSIKKTMPYLYNKDTTRIKDSLLFTLSKYIKAQVILMIIVFFISLVGILIIQPSYAIFISIGIAIADFVPLFGSGFFLIPWAIFSFIYGDTRMGIHILILYAIISVTRQLLEPRILGKQIGLHPIIAIMSIYIGVRVFGIFGFFIGPVVAIIVKIINAK